MPQSRLIHFSACLATLFSLTHCGGDKASTVPCTAGEAGCQAAAGGSSSTGTANGTSAGGVTSVGGTTATNSTASVGGTSTTSSTSSVGGTSATSSTTAKGGSSAAGGASAAGGTSAKGGASAVGGASAAGGTSAKGGASAVGGTNSVGGTSAKASTSVGGNAPTGGTSATGGTAAGGTTAKASTSSVGGNAPTGGTSSAATTAAATGGTTTDQSGVPLAKPGDKTSNSKEYLNLGEIRLLNNKWGSDELGCNTSLSVNVNSDKSVGWTFNRGNCGDDGSHPDFPELEFGINPFGANSSLRTSPAFSSTTLLPIQIKNITSASVILDSFTLSIPNTQGARWDNAFEFWISKNDPVASANPEVYAELIAFYSWHTDPKLSWACDATGSVKAGDKTYDLCHQKDAWPTGGSAQWRFFHLNVQGGQTNNFSGKVDVKAFLDWMVQSYGVSKDYYLTRIEIGTEYDDNTVGSSTTKNATFEINGATRSIQTQ